MVWACEAEGRKDAGMGGISSGGIPFIIANPANT
jgi:hypothetical protein